MTYGLKMMLLGMGCGFLIVRLSHGQSTQKDRPVLDTKIAFMADVHFADVFPNRDTLSDGIGLGATKSATPLIRTMASQMRSTRLFNENYFAFHAALEDAVSKGVKIIALPGDFSDDGQEVHTKGLRRILEYYEKQHGVLFFLAPGNHDPTTPFGEHAGKTDFLGENGKAQPVMSTEGLYESDPELENPTLLFESIKEGGYRDITSELRQFGFFPRKEYSYWETPFSTYTYEDYNLEKGKRASVLEKRLYSLTGTDILLPDVSYLVEPVAGLWLLSLDANVFLHKENGEFYGNGIGYDQVLEHKPYLVAWTKKVAARAKELGKVLIAFSHYPMVDFNDGASEKMKALFGADAFQAHRNPSGKVGEIFADAGLKVHVGGHMHLNDTGKLRTAKGNEIINIQSPSLAAYPAGYTVMEVKNNAKLRVSTAVLESVPWFATFFDQYRKEARFLKTRQDLVPWDTTILNANTYGSFVNLHLKELVRLRFLPKDWPKALTDLMVPYHGLELLALANDPTLFISVKQDQTAKRKDREAGTRIALGELTKALNAHGLRKADFESWTGMDWILDFYRLRNGDQVSLDAIGKKRLKAYSFLIRSLEKQSASQEISPLVQFATIFKMHLEGATKTGRALHIK